MIASATKLYDEKTNANKVLETDFGAMHESLHFVNIRLYVELHVRSIYYLLIRVTQSKPAYTAVFG